MKKWLLVALCCCATASAVEPAYEGPMGNPEEPALRPFKWALNGVGALFYQTGKGFRDGNMNTPVLGSAEALRGLGIGTLELGESTYNGLVYKPLTDRKEYKKTHRLNKRVDEDLLLRNVRDGASELILYPVVKLNDHHPAENDAKKEARLEQAKATRDARKEAAEARDLYKNLTRVERAQMRHVPERAEKSISKKDNYSGNLLKLAK